MTDQKAETNLPGKIYQYLELMVSMFGYVPKNASIPRTLAMICALAFALYLNYFQSHNSDIAILYFIISEICYLGFVTMVLSKNGLRHWFVKKWGETQGYLTYEGILGFLFFQNGISIGYIASSSPGNLFHFLDKNILFVLVMVLFIGGFTIKIWATKVVNIEIYYWKDMFLGRKISDFVVTGPYKYVSNPMYGLGQLQAYAVAIWYGSIHGLIAAMLNQFLIFLFYYLVEKKFIKNVYQKDVIQAGVLK